MSNASPRENCVIQFNYRTPAGALINLYAQDVAHASQLLEELEGLLPQSAAIESLITGVDAVKPVAQPSAPVQAAAQTSSPPAGDIPTCAHGQRKFVEGTSKAGKPYRAWFCPSPDRANQCDAQWVRD